MGAHWAHVRSLCGEGGGAMSGLLHSVNDHVGHYIDSCVNAGRKHKRHKTQIIWFSHIWVCVWGHKVKKINRREMHLKLKAEVKYGAGVIACRTKRNYRS